MFRPFFSRSRYTEAELLPCANALARLHRKAGTASLTAVHKKYSNPKYLEARSAQRDPGKAQHPLVLWCTLTVPAE